MFGSVPLLKNLPNNKLAKIADVLEVVCDIVDVLAIESTKVQTVSLRPIHEIFDLRLQDCRQPFSFTV